MSGNQQDVQRIFGRRAAFYTTSPAHTDAAVLERVVELAGPQAGWAVLDVGTGSGHTAFALADKVRSVIGLDLTPEMLAEAEGLACARGVGNFSTELGDVHSLPYAAGTFDLVTCRRAAHHFADIRLALSEMLRVLKPGGRLVIDDRSGPEDDRLDALMNHLDELHDPSHVRQYRPSEWDELLTEAGLVVETVEGYARHRPVSALTEGADEATAHEIEAIVAGLQGDDAQAMGAYRVEGELRHNHWYVLVAGRKPTMTDETKASQHNGGATTMKEGTLIKGMAHTCFNVADLERSLVFYRDQLGLTEAFPFLNDEGIRTGQYLYLSGRQFIELFERPISAPAADQSYKHICLEVEGLDDVVAELRRRGVEVSDPKLGKDQSWQAWITDPDGNRIELHDYTPQSWQAPWVK